MIVGHRGSGKTSLLKRWKKYQPQLLFIDLDEEIEKNERRSIQNIFLSEGERKFRELEKSTWEKIQHADRISVGGGFDLSLINTSWQILWLRRDSDSSDRIFIDRPILPSYDEIFKSREVNFDQYADSIYTVPEGLFEQDDEIEKKILLGDVNSVGGTVTLPRRFYSGSQIEIRDDLEMRLYETQNLIYSVRRGTTYPQNLRIDWDIKRPLPKNLQPFIISTHEQNKEPLKAFENSYSLLKFCPLITTWDELEAGIHWQKQNPTKHVFLPRSENGKWNWFRLWMKGKQPLNFWREGAGSNKDQPTLWEWMNHPENVTFFAAVLGSPVSHSFSPMYHNSFFKKRGLPFYRIDISEGEWSVALPVLQKLGLVAAAVTSPLKTRAGQFVQKSALNTIWLQNGKWEGQSTDEMGAQGLMKDFEKKTCVVWGGGGVLAALQNVLTKASYYSSRIGKPREGFNEENNPEVLIWGDPQNSISKIPSHWTPETVVDLSYHDKSPGRVYAQNVKAKYISGLKMFNLQAEAQQKIWENLSFK